MINETIPQAKGPAGLAGLWVDNTVTAFAMAHGWNAVAGTMGASQRCGTMTRGTITEATMDKAGGVHKKHIPLLGFHCFALHQHHVLQGQYPLLDNSCAGNAV